MIKKILLYTDTPQIGGAELQMFLLAKFLNKNRFRPILACGKSPALDKWCRNFNDENIEVLRMNVKHKHDPRHYFQLKKILKNAGIDLMHLHVWNPASGRYGYFAAKKINVPLIVTEHDPFQLGWLKNEIKKKGLKYVQKIITVSQNNADLLKKIYPEYRDRVFVIHNGIDVTKWLSQLLRKSPEERRKIKEEIFQAALDTLIIITVAELHERKGLKYLISATADLVKKFSNIKLVIIGRGGEKNNLEDLSENLGINDRVIFLGQRKNIAIFLKNSDIFALPSLREAFGMVNLEAMITGLPVVASRVGGISEVVENGKTGFLMEPGNSKNIALTLEKLIIDEKLREKFGQNGKKRVIENFDAKIMAENYQKIYQNLLDK